MNIEKDSVVGISYTLKEVNTGELVETVADAHPFYFLFGSGNLLEDFEGHLHGKSAGEAFDFQLSPEQAYGPIDHEAVVDLPVSAFMIQGRFAEEYVKEGEIIQMQDPEGNALPGRVVKRGLETVTIDFNHPMAGKHLHFTGKVMEVRSATAEELDHGHVHGPGGHQH
jgi:FKBP-type peptidyl-prolyl cis-trans isomerase SlyD